MGEEEYETLPTSSASTHMMAGAAAGVLEHSVVYPVDSVKVRNCQLSSVVATQSYRSHCSWT